MRRSIARLIASSSIVLIATFGASRLRADSETGGITADVAAKRALASSHAAKIDEAKLRAAGAQVDAAFSSYLPKLTLSARYTRLSAIDPPTIGGGPGSLVVTTSPPGPIGPGATLFAAPPIALPVVLDQYAAQASLLVPVSDYAFRVYHAHEGALANLEATKWAARVTSTQVATDARVAFYNVIRARGIVQVAKAAIAQTAAHRKEITVRLAQGEATKADVARIDALAAAADLALTRAETLVTLTEANLRTSMHVSDAEAIALGEDVSSELPRLVGDLKTAKVAAMAKRPELKAIDAQIGASSANAELAGAAMLPRLDVFGSYLYANPNPRFAFTGPSWKGTWEVGVAVSWSPTDAIVAGEQKKAATASTAALVATRAQLEDALGLDVTAAFAKVREMESAVVASGVERRAAEVAYDARLAQFKSGVTTSALLIDAETDATRARLNELNARVDLRIAHAQLKKATGES